MQLGYVWFSGAGGIITYMNTVLEQFVKLSYVWCLLGEREIIINVLKPLWHANMESRTCASGVDTQVESPGQKNCLTFTSAASRYPLAQTTKKVKLLVLHSLQEQFDSNKMLAKEIIVIGEKQTI